MDGTYFSNNSIITINADPSPDENTSSRRAKKNHPDPVQKFQASCAQFLESGWRLCSTLLLRSPYELSLLLRNQQLAESPIDFFFPNFTIQTLGFVSWGCFWKSLTRCFMFVPTTMGKKGSKCFRACSILWSLNADGKYLWKWPNQLEGALEASAGEVWCCTRSWNKQIWGFVTSFQSFYSTTSSSVQHSSQHFQLFCFKCQTSDCGWISYCISTIKWSESKERSRGSSNSSGLHTT